MLRISLQRFAQHDSASHEQVLTNQFANSRLSSFNSATNASMLFKQDITTVSWTEGATLKSN